MLIVLCALALALVAPTPAFANEDLADQPPFGGHLPPPLVQPPSEHRPPPGFRLDWIAGAPLPDLLEELSPPAGNRFVFFAGEKAEAEQARAWMTARGIEKSESRAAAYWTA